VTARDDDPLTRQAGEAVRRAFEQLPDIMALTLVARPGSAAAAVLDVVCLSDTAADDAAPEASASS
jgi:hypothetical protein